MEKLCVIFERRSDEFYLVLLASLYTMNALISSGLLDCMSRFARNGRRHTPYP
jgi:hypothetical protein